MTNAPRLTLLAFAISLASVHAPWAAISFGVPSSAPMGCTAAGNGVYGVAKGDFNGDGALDLAATVHVNVGGVGGRSYLYVLLGNGDGTFQAPVIYNFPGFDSGAGIYGILAKDFDKD